MNSKYRTFSSYKGLDRTVLIMGVPLIPAVILVMLSVFTMIGCLVLFGLGGILFLVVYVPIGFFLKTITENDDKALSMLALEMRYRFKRVAYKEFGDTLTYQPERYLRHKKTNEQIFTSIKE